MESHQSAAIIQPDAVITANTCMLPRLRALLLTRREAIIYSFAVLVTVLVADTTSF